MTLPRGTNNIGTTLSAWWASIPAGFRYFFAFILGTLVCVILSSCAPKQKPAPAVDTTTTSTDTVATPDSASSDSAQADTAEADSTQASIPDSVIWPKEYRPDTTVVTEEDLRAVQRAAASVDTGRRRAITSGGLMFGMYTYRPYDKWCASSGVINTALLAIEPKYALEWLRAADRCGFHLMIGFPRKMMNTTGTTIGHFSLSNYKSMLEVYKRTLSPAVIKDYVNRRVLVGFMALDDMGSAWSWGGTVISQQTTAQAMKAAQAALPDAPICLRVHPQWMLRNGMTKASWAMPDGTSSVDCAMSQWYEIFSTYRPFLSQQAWYDAQRVAQQTLGIPKQQYTVAYGGCYNAVATICSADRIKKYGLVANAYPNNCANLGWQWKDIYRNSPYIDAIKAVAADAARRPTTTCRS